jgi:hypothetical protein
MNEIVSLTLTLFPTPLGGFSPFFWWLFFFPLFMWLFTLQMGYSIEDDVVDDGLQLSTLVEEKTRDVITNLLNHA